MMERHGAVTLRGDSLEVVWPCGASSVLPYLWLRDNCDCGDCRVEQTSEKRFMINAVAADLAPASVDLTDDLLLVTWPDGHRSHYRSADVLGQAAARGPTWQPWDSAFVPLHTDYQGFLDDDGQAAAAIAEFLRHGAIVLEAAPSRPGTLESLAPRLGPIREVLFARIHDVKVDLGGYNVAHTAMELPPHNDFASYSWPPSVQALHMLVNEAAGGETVIVDGWRVLRALREEHSAMFESLCNVPVPFREFDDDTETYAVAPLVRLDANGNIVSLRFSNQLMQRIDPAQPGVAGFYRAYRELCRRLTDTSAKATFRLHAGNILIVASHRVLHGRTAFDAEGARHLQDAYFELDNVANHLVLLSRGGVRAE
jgi:gamma-butyrobetaine dioxygenase